MLVLLNQYGGSFIKELHGESPFTDLECIGARKDCVCPTSVNEMPAGKTLPCQKEACAIQKCLQEQNYQEDRCRQVIEAMRKCCKRESAINTKLCLGFKEPLNSTT